ncbi:MAG TPA: hypothetical protein DIS66_05060 [Candidatus Omnitrophica bacterium]|nr:hypothetical protein [Candidatus Omnitrophota bacterium]
MKKTIMMLFSFAVLSASAFALEPIQESAAFKKYQNRTPTELSKLIYLLDRFNTTDTEIQIDGNIYTAEKAFPYGKSFLAKNYKKENAADWLREHCYRTKDENKVIYIRFHEEKFRPFRDVLIEELERLNQI